MTGDGHSGARATMDERDVDGAQDNMTRDGERPLSASNLPPPPAHHPAWLGHVQPLPLHQFPQTPASSVFETTLSRNDSTSSLKSSTAFHRFLLNNHPVYAHPGIHGGQRNDAATSQLSKASAANHYIRHESPFRGRSIPPPPSLPGRPTTFSSRDPRYFSLIQGEVISPAPTIAYTQPSIASSSLHRSRFRTPSPPPETPATDNVLGADFSALTIPVDHNIPNQRLHEIGDITTPSSELSGAPEIDQEFTWTPGLEQSTQYSTYPPSFDYNFNANNSHQWNDNFGNLRLPLPPQTIEYDQDVAGGVESLVDTTNGRVDESTHLVPQAPVFHPPPIHHQISNVDDVGQTSELDAMSDSNSENDTEIDPPRTGQKRKRDGNQSDAGHGRRRTGKRGRPKGRRGAEGPRTVLAPGEDFTKLYNAAMDAFLDEKDITKAQIFVLEAISMNPEIFAAHSLLADIHFARGDHEAAIDALMVGLHGHANDVELWRQVADTILNDHTEGYRKRVERAMYCYAGILRKDPKDLDARFQRAECARILGNWNKAFGDLSILLQDDPHNSTVLALFTRVCHGVADTSRAKSLYQEHLDYYRTTGISEDNHFTWQDISNYVDLIAQTGQTAEAVVVFRQLARWLCGRESESFWDDYPDDDREFDQMHHPRRTDVLQFGPGRFSEHEYGEALPLDLRGKLGVLRLKLGHREEAQAHFDWLEVDLEGEESLVHEYSDTFFDVAKGLLEVKEYKLALQYFDALHNEGIDLGLDFWMGMAACCYVCGRKDKAIEFYEHTLEINPDAIESRTQLAKLYNDQGSREKALKYGREALLLAQDAIPATMNRKYERKEQRLIREEATKVLKMAYRMPRVPGKAPGKVPAELRRPRNSRKFVRYIPRYTEQPETIASFASGEEEGRDKPKEKGRRKGRVKVPKPPKPTKPPKEPKAPKLPKPPKPPKVPKRQLPSQEDAIKHYEEMQGLYQTLLNHQDAMREGDEVATNTWMDCADVLVKDFRTVKAFYPSERNKKFEGFGKTFMEPRPQSATPAAASPAPSASVSQSQLQPPNNDNLDRTSPAVTRADRDLIDTGTTRDYCGISFTTWLDIHLELALLIAISPNLTSESQKQCYDIITAATDCTIFYHSESRMVQIHMCWLACCLALGDDYTLFNVVLRWFMREFAFCTDTFRLYSAINFLNELPSNPNGKTGQLVSAEFKSGPNQKFLFRQLVSIDKLLPADYNAGGAEGPVPAFMRRHREELRKLSNKADKNGIINDEAIDNTAYTTPNNNNNADTPEIDDPEQQPNTPTSQRAKAARRDRLENTAAVKHFRPQEMDVVLFILYAHILMASSSFTNALSYLYRAYSLDPKNPICLLSMAFCYMHELFKRQNENRHMYVLFGWAWFGRYEAERLTWAERVDRRNEEEKTRRSSARGDDENQEIHDDDSTDDGESESKAKILPIVKREIEFNKARCWEMLGMADLAVRGYKKVLTLPEPVKLNDDDDEGGQDEADADGSSSMEAAYAMATLYALNGDIKMAREITERWLVV